MISASAVTKRHELIMSLVAGLNSIKARCGSEAYESLLAIGGMRVGTRLRQGVKPNGQPPRIQVALATGKLVLPEQGCLGQGGCEAKPD